MVPPTSPPKADSTIAAGRDVVICAPLRTPVGRFDGALRAVPAAALATKTLQALLARTGLDGAAVDDVILGHCYPNGEAPAIGRVAALDAGLGISVGGLQIDRRCGSGLQAVLYAVLQVGCGASRLVVAGGVESMSNVEHYALGLRHGVRGGSLELVDRLDRARVTAGGESYPVPGGMLQTAENLRLAYGISRQAQDELALASQQRCAAAIAAGSFDDELIEVTVPGRRRGETTVVGADEHPRPDTTFEQLARLRPVLGRQDPEATVTAGNASGQNDGAAMCVVTTRADANRHGLRPMLRPVAWALAGVEPATMGIGPVPATSAALNRAGLRLDQVDLIELNEAFAAQVLACLHEWGIKPDDDRLNPNGSGISLGHPVGATGARILATMAYEMQRREARYGLETMCIGGGQGLAAVFERVG